MHKSLHSVFWMGGSFLFCLLDYISLKFNSGYSLLWFPNNWNRYIVKKSYAEHIELLHSPIELIVHTNNEIYCRKMLVVRFSVSDNRRFLFLQLYVIPNCRSPPQVINFQKTNYLTGGIYKWITIIQII